MSHEDGYRFGLCHCQECRAKHWLDEIAFDGPTMGDVINEYY